MDQTRRKWPLLDSPAEPVRGRPGDAVRDERPESPTESREELKTYLRKKQAIARAIRSLQEFLKYRESEAKITECHDLMVKLAEDRFTLAVVGQFKRGKSSLMNAIIGRELLPTGLLPLTSAVTILRFGPRERLVIPHEDWAFDEEAPISSLSDYVTEKGNPGNRKHIKAVYVEVPSPFLRRGLEFVDTPGIGSAIEANTATTYGFLPQCDAVLFVTSVDTPLGAAEMRFLRDLRQYIRKVFFIVNKADLVGEHERSEVLSFISATLRREIAADDLRVFPVSARAALAAKLKGDSGAVTTSGISEFENAMTAFLSGDKSATFLVAILDRAIRLLKAECREIDLQARVRDTVACGREDRLVKLKDQLRQARTSYDANLNQVRVEVARDAMEAFSEQLASFAQQELQILRKEASDWVCGARWELLQTIGRGFAGAGRARFERNLSTWASEQGATIKQRLREIVERERQNVTSQTGAMSRAAEEVFGLIRQDAADASTEPDSPYDLSSCDRTLRAPPWRPRLSIPWRFLPVRLNRSWFARLLVQEAERWLTAVRASVLSTFQQRLNETLDGLGRHLTKELEKAEAHVLQIVARATTNAPAQDGVVFKNDAGQNERRTRLEHRLETLRDKIISGEDIRGLPEGQAPAVDQAANTIIAIKEKHPVEKESDGATKNLAKRNCPICARVAHALFDFFGSTQYALATDEHAQRLHAEELGFCPLHTWLLSSIASPLGLSTGYPRLTERLSADLSALAIDPPDSGAPVKKLLANPHTCRACHFIRHAEDKYVREMAERLKEPAYREAYSRSQGVCLRHLAMLMDAASAKETTRYLLVEAARRFAELNEDMQSFAIKRDATRRGLVNKDEEDAYLRTMVHLVGDRYLATAHPADAEF